MLIFSDRLVKWLLLCHLIGISILKWRRYMNWGGSQSKKERVLIGAQLKHWLFQLLFMRDSKWDYQDKMWREVLFHIDIQYLLIRAMNIVIFLLIQSNMIHLFNSSKYVILIYLNMQLWALNMVIHKLILILLLFGKHSSEIFQMELK